MCREVPDEGYCEALNLEPNPYAQAFVIPCHAHVRYICTSVSDFIRHIPYICLTYADTRISERLSLCYGLR